jgi:hypothetical protein
VTSSLWEHDCTANTTRKRTAADFIGVNQISQLVRDRNLH